MSEAIPILQALGGFAILLGLGYWGGQIKRTTDKLCEVTGDHETRLRDLEHAE